MPPPTSPLIADTSPLISLDACKQLGLLRKLYGAVGVVFKGSGFYRTDNRSTSSPAPASSASDSSSSSASSSSSSTPSSSTSSTPAAAAS